MTTEAPIMPVRLKNITPSRACLLYTSTTLPEVMVSTTSALTGHGEIAYGNGESDGEFEDMSFDGLHTDAPVSYTHL